MKFITFDLDSWRKPQALDQTNDVLWRMKSKLITEPFTIKVVYCSRRNLLLLTAMKIDFFFNRRIYSKKAHYTFSQRFDYLFDASDFRSRVISFLFLLKSFNVLADIMIHCKSGCKSITSRDVRPYMSLLSMQTLLRTFVLYITIELSCTD